MVYIECDSHAQQHCSTLRVLRVDVYCLGTGSLFNRVEIACGDWMPKYYSCVQYPRT